MDVPHQADWRHFYLLIPQNFIDHAIPHVCIILLHEPPTCLLDKNRKFLLRYAGFLQGMMNLGNKCMDFKVFIPFWWILQKLGTEIIISKKYSPTNYICHIFCQLVDSQQLFNKDRQPFIITLSERWRDTTTEFSGRRRRIPSCQRSTRLLIISHLWPKIVIQRIVCFLNPT